MKKKFKCLCETTTRQQMDKDKYDDLRNVTESGVWETEEQVSVM